MNISPGIAVVIFRVRAACEDRTYCPAVGLGRVSPFRSHNTFTVLIHSLRRAPAYDPRVCFESVAVEPNFVTPF
jgi:hypothetical protein